MTLYFYKWINKEHFIFFAKKKSFYFIFIIEYTFLHFIGYFLFVFYDDPKPACRFDPD